MNRVLDRSSFQSVYLARTSTSHKANPDRDVGGVFSMNERIIPVMFLTWTIGRILYRSKKIKFHRLFVPAFAIRSISIRNGCIDFDAMRCDYYELWTDMLMHSIYIMRNKKYIKEKKKKKYCFEDSKIIKRLFL